MKRQTFKYPGNAAFQRLLEKYNCPAPFHVVLFRFLGEIASLDFGARPIKIVESFWDDDLPVPSRSPYGKAEPLYQRALVILVSALGPEHPEVAKVFENYALLLRETGRDAEAAKMEARAKAIRAKHAKENP